MVRVGDTLTLPSGHIVYIAAASDPRRPWRAHQVGALWGVRRERPPEQVHREAWEHYTGDKSVPLLLVLHDAVALAFALNRVGPTDLSTSPSRSPTARASDAIRAPG